MKNKEGIYKLYWETRKGENHGKEREQRKQSRKLHMAILYICNSSPSALSVGKETIVYLHFKFIICFLLNANKKWEDKRGLESEEVIENS